MVFSSARRCLFHCGIAWRAPEMIPTGICFGESPFPIEAPFPREGGGGGLLPDPKNKSAEIYLGKSPWLFG